MAESFTNEVKIGKINAAIELVERNVASALLWFKRLDATLDPRIREELVQKFAKIMHLTTTTYGTIQEPVSMNRELSEKTQETMMLLENFISLYNKINMYAGRQVEDKARRRYIRGIFTILHQSLLDMDYKNPRYISIDTSALDNTNTVERKIKRVLDKAAKTFNLASDNYKEIKEEPEKNKVSRMIERMKNIISPHIPEYDPTQNTLLTFSDEVKPESTENPTETKLTDIQLDKLIKQRNLNVQTLSDRYDLDAQVAADMKRDALSLPPPIAHPGFIIITKPSASIKPVVQTVVQTPVQTPVQTVVQTPKQPAFISTPMAPVVQTPVQTVVQPPVQTVVQTVVQTAVQPPKQPASTSTRAANKMSDVSDYFSMHETKQQTSVHVPSAPSTISNPDVPDYFSMYYMSLSTKK